MESQLAVDADLASTAGSLAPASSDVAAGSAVTAGSVIRSLRGVAPGSEDYSLKFPVVYLTPKLIRSEESLAMRGRHTRSILSLFLLTVAMCTLGVRMASLLASSASVQTLWGRTN